LLCFLKPKHLSGRSTVARLDLKHWPRSFVLLQGLVWPVIAGFSQARADSELELYRSPFDVAFSPDGARLAATDYTAGAVTLIDPQAATVTASIPLHGQPTGLAWSPAGERLFVAEFGAGTVAEIDVGAGRVVRRLPVGRDPIGVALPTGQPLLLAANSTTHTVSVIDLRSGRAVTQIPTAREPFAIAIVPDGSHAVVTNLLPAGRATDSDHAASVTLLDLKQLTVAGEVRLPPGSSSTRDIAVSPDGRWAYAVHTLGRTNLPATQLERGWVNTNAMSIIDLRTRTLYATLLLDQPMEGAANPWGVALAPDGQAIYVSIAGVHWLARINLETLHRYLAGGIEDNHRLAKQENSTLGSENIWLRIKRDPQQRHELVNDLAALHAANLLKRVDLPVRGPRGVDLAPDGRTVAVAGYFSANIALVDSQAAQLRTVSLGPSPEPDLARRGEIIFHDATCCFQHWLSCSTCHPCDGRVDGLNWDLLNDGIGNPKNVKSLLWAHQTPPMTWQGVRPSLEVSVEKGFFLELHRASRDELEAVRAYLRSLAPRPSPYRERGGGMSAAAKRGQEIFRGQPGCAACHEGTLMTDRQLHDVGTRGPSDRSELFDTPSLVELYATAPYLHDGSAATLHEVIERNVDDQHGATSDLTPNQIEDLIAYLISL
jgi:YVTN family beta-propeller protein